MHINDIVVTSRRHGSCLTHPSLRMRLGFLWDGDYSRVSIRFNNKREGDDVTC